MAMAMALLVVVVALHACSAIPVPSSASSSTAAAEAKRSLAAASSAIENRNFAQANTLLRDALRKLGDEYHSPSTVDDTGMSLVLADSEEQKGREDIAAKLRRNVLATRLAILEQRKLGP
ncbi:hypothetical protein [Variovorax sp. DT-64]|uniref:hypothetical protein n=1 Tax=Variovorax sp. DT-64 TaxID=3396160 RepID=UPI003F1B8C42